MSTKTIDGHIFHVQSQHKTKASAKKEAAWLRKMGNRVRIFPGALVGQHGYVVYTSRVGR